MVLDRLSFTIERIVRCAVQAFVALSRSGPSPLSDLSCGLAESRRSGADAAEAEHRDKCCCRGRGSTQWQEKRR